VPLRRQAGCVIAASGARGYRGNVSAAYGKPYCIGTATSAGFAANWTAKLVVHHRRPGVDRLADLITLCRRCHVRIHRTWRPSFWFLTFELLRRLWREVNRDLAEQRLLALLEAPRPAEQAGLFEWAAEEPDAVNLL